MDKLTLDILGKAQQKVVFGWCQEDWARDKQGDGYAREQINSRHERKELCEYCAAGAIYAAFIELYEQAKGPYGVEGVRRLNKAWEAAIRAMVGASESWRVSPVPEDTTDYLEQSLTAWNDDAQDAERPCCQSIRGGYHQGQGPVHG